MDIAKVFASLLDISKISSKPLTDHGGCRIFEHLRRRERWGGRQPVCVVADFRPASPSPDVPPAPEAPAAVSASHSPTHCLFLLQPT